MLLSSFWISWESLLFESTNGISISNDRTIWLHRKYRRNWYVFWILSPINRRIRIFQNELLQYITIPTYRFGSKDTKTIIWSKTIRIQKILRAEPRELSGTYPKIFGGGQTDTNSPWTSEISRGDSFNASFPLHSSQFTIRTSWIQRCNPLFRTFWVFIVRCVDNIAVKVNDIAIVERRV